MRSYRELDKPMIDLSFQTADDQANAASIMENDYLLDAYAFCYLQQRGHFAKTQQYQKWKSFREIIYMEIERRVGWRK
jgi:hypothetical protein